MNLREVAIRISKRIPGAIVLEHSDPVVLVHNGGTRITTIPEFTVLRGSVLTEEMPDAPMCHPPLSPDELVAAAAWAVENYWHNLLAQLPNADPAKIRTFITVSPNLDPEAVDVGVCLFEAV